MEKTYTEGDQPGASLSNSQYQRRSKLLLLITTPGIKRQGRNELDGSDADDDIPSKAQQSKHSKGEDYYSDGGADVMSGGFHMEDYRQKLQDPVQY
jgi:hypothetical protein